jgi:cytochrome c oxidase subunit I+III
VYDQDIRNVTLYWHFMAFTAVVAFAVLGLFPMVSA